MSAVFDTHRHLSPQEYFAAAAAAATAAAATERTTTSHPSLTTPPCQYAAACYCSVGPQDAQWSDFGSIIEAATAETNSARAEGKEKEEEEEEEEEDDIGGSSSSQRILAPKAIFGFGVHPWWVTPEDKLTAAEQEAQRRAEKKKATGLTFEPPVRKNKCCEEEVEVEEGQQDEKEKDASPAPPKASTFSEAPSPHHHQSTPPLLLPSDWKLLLREYLTAHPKAIVAEIGLDKLKNAQKIEVEVMDASSSPKDDDKEKVGERGATEEGNREADTNHSAAAAKEVAVVDLFQLQLEAFHFQLDLAAQLRRPVSCHCVKAWGPMLESFTTRIQKKAKAVEIQWQQQQEVEEGSAEEGTSAKRPKQPPPHLYHNLLPPVIIFHGFTGSKDFIKSLLSGVPKKVLKGSAGGGGVRFYFGIGSATTMKMKNVTTNLFPFLPLESVLLESDCWDLAEGIAEGEGKEQQQHQPLVLCLSAAEGLVAGGVGARYIQEKKKKKPDVAEREALEDETEAVLQCCFENSMKAFEGFV